MRHAWAWLVLAVAPAAAQTLDQALALHRDGRLDEALAAYRAVATEREASDPSTAGAARNNACVLLSDRGDFRAALVECRLAERLRRAAGEEFRLARTLNNLGLALQYGGDPAEAERVFREALTINRRLGEAEESVVVLGNLAALAIGEGRYGPALDRLGEAEAALAAHAKEPWALEQRRLVALNRAVAYERLGAFREALAVLDELARGSEPDRHRAAQLAVNRGVLLRNLGDTAGAAAAFTAAIAELERLGDRAALANAWVNVGLAAHLDLHEPARAEAAFERALALANEGGDLGGAIEALYSLGRLLIDRGRLSEAHVALSRALALAVERGDAEGRWSALAALARIERGQGRRDRALELLEQAIEVIEQVRSGVRQRTLRAGWLGDKRAVYAAAVELAAERAQASQRRDDVLAALALVQRAKARELLDSIGGGFAPLDAKALGVQAERGGTVLEFFAGERTLWRWRLGGGEATLVAIGPVDELLAEVAVVHAALARGGALPAGTMERLATRLLAGLDGLRGSVAIAPDSRLRYLPFEALPLPDGTLLVERLAVSYLPSVSWLAAPPRARSEPRWELAGLAGDAVEPASWRGAASLLATRFALPALPAAGRELEQAANALGGQSRLARGAEATEERWREMATEGARVFHFAAHAVVDERLEPGAALFLAPAGDDDGLLSASEIAATPVRGDLVVLSGCRTALGSTADGRALSTLTGAFLAAGARGVVASLWEVGDEATAAFMGQFYFALGEGAAPAEALRLAKVRLRQSPGWEAPARWSAFVLTGDVAPVVRRRLLWPFAFGALAFVFAAIAWRLRRRT